jgi:hypothetical protein
VIAFTSVAANLAAIMGGILVFRDPIGIGAPAIVGRVIAFGSPPTDAAIGVLSVSGWPCGQNSQPKPECSRRRYPRHEAIGGGYCF